MWKDTEPENIIWYEKLDGTRVRLYELKKNNVFSPWWNGSYMNLSNEIVEEKEWFRTTSEPRQADGTESHQDYGWCCPAEGPLDKEEIKKVLS